MDFADESCQELCTGLAAGITVPVDVSGVCDYPVTDGRLTDVVVTGCHITSVSSLRVSEETMLVTVQVVVSFRFTGILPNDRRVEQTAECATTIEFLLSILPPVAFFDIPCTAELKCEAVDAGFDPQLAAQEFIVAVNGTVTCTGCQRAVVNVQRCSAHPASA